MKYQVIDINSSRMIILKLEAEFVTGVNNNKVKDVFLSIPLFLFCPPKWHLVFQSCMAVNLDKKDRKLKLKCI